MAELLVKSKILLNVLDKTEEELRKERQAHEETKADLRYYVELVESMKKVLDLNTETFRSLESENLFSDEE